MDQPQSIQPRARHVLVVEDDRLLRRALRRMLELEGHRVTAAGSLAEAHAVLDGQDTVLLDMELPDGYGAELLRHLRQAKSRARIAIVSGAPPEILDAARELSPDRVFPKPFDIVQLLNWVAHPSRPSEEP